MSARVDEIADARLRAVVASTDSSCSGDELASTFSAKHGGRLIYVAAWDRWLIWSGKQWIHDAKRRVFDYARNVCREELAERLARQAFTANQLRALRQRLGSAATVWSVVKLAGSDPRHAVTPDQLDANPWQLNTPGGVIDLRTGTVGPHDPAALCTKMTAAVPVGDCPTWQAVLNHALPDPEVSEYLQRLFGYGLTGSSREHVAPFVNGPGGTSKSTIVGAFRRAMGNYALDVPAELLTESHNERHPCELAVLHGARFVVGSEIDQGKRWNESRLKRLTGGDRISARFIARDPFDFEPTHTLVILANAKPAFRCVDEAIRRRVHLIPFIVPIAEAERDPQLPEKLAAEYGGILAWAVEGCVAWQRDGLNPPPAVRAASAAYLDSEDNVAGWIDERCERRGQVKLTAAHRDYRTWCESAGQPPLGRNAFGDQLEAHGIPRTVETRGRTVIFSGLSILAPDQGWRDEF